MLLDFPHQMAYLNPAPTSSLARRQALLQRGYRAIPLTRIASDGRYVIQATVNGVTAPIVLSTVAGTFIDSTFAQQAAIGLGAATGRYGGPSGTTGFVYGVSKPVAVMLDGVAYPLAAPLVENMYAYIAQQQPTAGATARAGSLGADFLLANAAVVDFGNSVLYLKPKKGK